MTRVGAMCAAWGIPEAHVSAVEERVRAARRAIVLVPVTAWHDLDSSEIAERVVGGAAADYAAGVLERRCAP